MEQRLSYDCMVGNIRDVCFELSQLCRIFEGIEKYDRISLWSLRSMIHIWKYFKYRWYEGRSESSLEISVRHAYDHLNFVWNVRHIPIEQYTHLTSEEHFQWGKFPSHFVQKFQVTEKMKIEKPQGKNFNRLLMTIHFERAYALAKYLYSRIEAQELSGEQELELLICSIYREMNRGWNVRYYSTRAYHRNEEVAEKKWEEFPENMDS